MDILLRALPHRSASLAGSRAWTWGWRLPAQRPGTKGKQAASRQRADLLLALALRGRATASQLGSAYSSATHASTHSDTRSHAFTHTFAAKGDEVAHIVVIPLPARPEGERRLGVSVCQSFDRAHIHWLAAGTKNSRCPVDKPPVNRSSTGRALLEWHDTGRRRQLLMRLQSALQHVCRHAAVVYMVAGHPFMTRAKVRWLPTSCTPISFAAGTP